MPKDSNLPFFINAASQVSEPYPFFSCLIEEFNLIPISSKASANNLRLTSSLNTSLDIFFHTDIKLPPELTRAGRLDAIWYFSLPSKEEREEIFKIHFKKRNQNISEDIIKFIAKETNNYTGAEIEQIVKSSIKKAYANKIKNNEEFKITKDILLKAKEDVIPISKSSREKIFALEDYANGRALYSNKKDKSIDIDSINIDDIEI